jgi:hypothetical protein
LVLFVFKSEFELLGQSKSLFAYILLDCSRTTRDRTMIFWQYTVMFKIYVDVIYLWTFNN